MSLTRREILLAPAAAALASPQPPVRTRMFWTWDHSTEWVLNRPGAQTLGASNYYARPAGVFLEDYTRLLEWCGGHGIDAVVVWGLLRDSHGGLESARRLCDVAARHRVRLLAGAGLNAYGGVYYEGDSPYNLGQHLERHPDLYALDGDGKRMVFGFGMYGPRASAHACPSRGENQEFAAASLRWLFQNLPLGGVQIESGDTGVCRCGLCLRRRRFPVSSFSWEDMSLMYPLASQAIRSVSPDAWIVCETYSHPEPHAGDSAPGFGGGKPRWAEECLAQFPDGVFVQWVADKFLPPKPVAAWTAAGVVSGGRCRNILRAHFGTYWGRFRGEPAVDWIAEMVRRGVTSGFDAMSLFGEVSPFHAGAELNYLALMHYGSAANPNADLDLFLRDVAGPLLGGHRHARDYLRFARLAEQPARIPAALPQIYRRAGSLRGDAARRWGWLAQHLAALADSPPG